MTRTIPRSSAESQTPGPRGGLRIAAFVSRWRPASSSSQSIVKVSFLV